ncbi:caspase family protein [Bradyrhizobium elkanii]|uniref:caspase family protein n=2 Tax=Bradyrhizobium elkanii TaxID=29448 RepID=UPI0030BA0526
MRQVRWLGSIIVNWSVLRFNCSEPGMRIVLLPILIAVLLQSSSFVEASEVRVALVVGNSDYRQFERLRTPANDAKDIAGVLTTLGYEVVFRRDIGSDDLRLVLRDFADKSAKADISIIYYAGYATTARGETYLVPVDAGFVEQKLSAKDPIALRAAMNAVAGARSLGLVILDGRRENSLETTLQQHEDKLELSTDSRAAARGVTLFFSAEPGKTVEEGNGRNSPFAAATMRYLFQPNLEVSFFFRNVRDEVRKATAQKQTPYTYGQLSSARIFLNSVSQRNLHDLKSDPPKVHACDLLAASPEDAGRDPSIYGVKVENIRAGEAVIACSEAAQQFPQIARFHYELGRAFFAAKNYSSALASYMRAFELGNLQALYAVGGMYESGDGVDKDPARARFYYETVAEMNFSPAIVSLGIQYEQGISVTRNLGTAYSYYRRAADLGNPRAVNLMGELTEKGLGTARDAVQARGLYERAADLGDSAAMLNLARCLADGIGGRKDVVEARRWLEKSSLAASPSGKELLVRLGKSKAR